MPTANQEQADSQLLEQTTRHSVMIERLKTGEVKKFEKYLRQIDALVREQLTRKELTTYSRDRLEKFLGRVDGKLLEIYKAFSDVVQADLVDIALYESTFEANSLSHAMSIDAVVPANAVIRAAVFSYPLQVKGLDGGKLLKSFLSGWTRAETMRVTNTIRLGFGQGQTNAQIIQAVRGTAAQNFTDGILAVSNRNAASVVQTAIQHVATTARMETLKANSDVVLGYRWLSTLDRKTSQQCKGLDGMRFDLGKGPLPPAHINCRSTTVPITRLSELFAKDATRASIGDKGAGQVDAGLNYYEWLATQPARFQDHALGPVRGKLFRDGGLTPEKFAMLQLDKKFKPLTLAELKAIEPDMFTRAGVTLGAPPG
ncbi:minor capsid protein [Pseudomonas frederiksbergensis]|nr:minor capsid protein [Pseudomonas frederiksbergensis]